MAGNTYKMTVTLSDGKTIDAGTFEAPQGPKGDASVNAETIYNLLEGSETIVADLNEDETKVELHLDNEVNNKITNSLQKPAIASESMLVGVSNDNGSVVQSNISLGKNMSITNNTLNAKIYQHKISFTTKRDENNSLTDFLYLYSTSSTPMTINDIYSRPVTGIYTIPNPTGEGYLWYLYYFNIYSASYKMVLVRNLTDGTVYESSVFSFLNDTVTEV